MEINEKKTINRSQDDAYGDVREDLFMK